MLMCMPSGEKKRQWQIAAERLYGQVKKSYRRCKVAQVERRMCCGAWEAFQVRLHALGVSRAQHPLRWNGSM